MKTISKMLLVLCLFTWISCEENADPVIDDSELLIGYWVNPVGIDTLLKYERAVGLKEDAYSFGFKEGHSFVERKNEGWCGTPPVTLKDYQGTWAKHDSLIDIDVPYWGGIAHYQWKIIALDNSSLTIAWVKQEFKE
jgi:hypothetical protein